MFVDVSGLIAHNPSGLHRGVAVADLDGDGRFEFVVAGFGGPNRVLRWTGGQLRDVAPPPLADVGQHAVGLAAGDLDGDGREELFVLNAATSSGTKQAADRLFRARPDGGWEDLFARPKNRLLRNAATEGAVAAIDRRGVGRYGFFVANDGQPLRLYEIGLDGTLADVALPLGLALTSGVRGVLTLPIFSDHPDVICLNSRGSNLVFRNRGDGSFTECAARLGLTDPEEQGRAVVAVDVRANANLDLCWGNCEGPHRLITRRADGSWRDRATPGLAFPSSVQTVIAADFDNDGQEELFFNNVGEPNRLFRVSGNGQHEPPESINVTMLDPGEARDVDGFGTGAATCDVDGDGVLELLVARGEQEPQPLGFFKARSAEGNNWIRVRPLTRFGAPARGAVVRAEVRGQVRVKGVCGGSGYLCQMEPVAHFGLGPGGRVERVQVTWPDGAAVVLLNPSVNRTVTLPYPRG